MAVVLPILVLLALAVGQVALVARARVMVTHAAREGARAAAVGESDALVRHVVVERSTLPPDRVRVEVVRSPSTVEVRVSYRDPTDAPLVGSLVGDVELVGVAVMRRE